MQKNWFIFIFSMTTDASYFQDVQIIFPVKCNISKPQSLLQTLRFNYQKVYNIFSLNSDNLNFVTLVFYYMIQSSYEQFSFFECFTQSSRCTIYLGASKFWSLVEAIIVFNCFTETLIKVKVMKDKHNFFVHVTDPKENFKEAEKQEINEEQQITSGQWIDVTDIKN